MSTQTTYDRVTAMALAVIDDLNFLRHEGGDTITILCANAGADDLCEQTGIDVCGEWTEWEEKRFLAVTWGKAVRTAASAKREYEEGLK